MGTVNPTGGTAAVSPPSTLDLNASAHTLQAFIELVYTGTANDVLVDQMASLESSLGVTSEAMSTLTNIQNLHNLVEVKSKGQFSARYFSANANVTSYTKGASAFFGTPVGVSASFSAISGGYAGANGFAAQMATIKTQLSSEIASLSLTTPLVNGVVDSNSLLANLKNVLNDINKTGAATSAKGAQNWIVDNYNAVSSVSVTSSGLIQQNITNAITAGQSLNTTQTESVRNYLYLFQEYYQSASAVLQAISQMIQKMADNVSGT